MCRPGEVPTANYKKISYNFSDEKGGGGGMPTGSPYDKKAVEKSHQQRISIGHYEAEGDRNKMVCTNDSR